MEEKLNKLIEEGDKFNFRNNCDVTSHGTYSKASDSLLAWIANVEDFIKENYGEDSSPYRLFDSYDRTKLSGNYQSAFEKQLTTIKGALKACKKIAPKPKKKIKDDNQITQMLKNPFYWTSLVIVIGGAFTIGLKFGSSKFDKEKSEYYEKSKDQEKEIVILKKETNERDSVIKRLNKEILILEDSLSQKSIK